MALQATSSGSFRLGAGELPVRRAFISFIIYTCPSVIKNHSLILKVSRSIHKTAGLHRQEETPKKNSLAASPQKEPSGVEINMSEGERILGTPNFNECTEKNMSIKDEKCVDHIYLIPLSYHIPDKISSASHPSSHTSPDKLFLIQSFQNI